MEWVIQDHLARSSRPGHPSRKVGLSEVEHWMDDATDHKIRSIICLLTKEQLEYYSKVPGGLLGQYEERGFRVVNVPVTDPAHDSRGYTELEEALGPVFDHYTALPHPVLIHCSAGVDRTSRAVEYICERLKTK